VGFDGSGGEHQSLRDFVVRRAAGEEFQHVEFAAGELVKAVSLIWRPGAGPLGAVLDQAPGNGRGQQRVSCHGNADGGDELVCWRGLEQESAGPAVQRFKDIFIEIEGGEKYDSRDGIPGGQLAGGRSSPSFVSQALL
jgi:hypothetical protein